MFRTIISKQFTGKQLFKPQRFTKSIRQFSNEFKRYHFDEKTNRINFSFNLEKYKSIKSLIDKGNAHTKNGIIFIKNFSKNAEKKAKIFAESDTFFYMLISSSIPITYLMYSEDSTKEYGEPSGAGTLIKSAICTMGVVGGGMVLCVCNILPFIAKYSLQFTGCCVILYIAEKTLYIKKRKEMREIQEMCE